MLSVRSPRCPTESVEQHLHVGQHAEQPGHSEQPDETQGGGVGPQTWDERSPHGDQVEHVPPAPQEAVGAEAHGGQPQRELDDEEPQKQVVHVVEASAVSGHDAVIGPEPQG